MSQSETMLNTMLNNPEKQLIVQALGRYNVNDSYQIIIKLEQLSALTEEELVQVIWCLQWHVDDYPDSLNVATTVARLWRAIPFQHVTNVPEDILRVASPSESVFQSATSVSSTLEVESESEPEPQNIADDEILSESDSDTQRNGNGSVRLTDAIIEDIINRSENVMLNPQKKGDKKNYAKTTAPQYIKCVKTICNKTNPFIFDDASALFEYLTETVGPSRTENYTNFQLWTKRKTVYSAARFFFNAAVKLQVPIFSDRLAIEAILTDAHTLITNNHQEANTAIDSVFEDGDQQRYLPWIIIRNLTTIARDAVLTNLTETSLETLQHVALTSLMVLDNFPRRNELLRLVVPDDVPSEKLSTTNYYKDGVAYLNQYKTGDKYFVYTLNVKPETKLIIEEILSRKKTETKLRPKFLLLDRYIDMGPSNNETADFAKMFETVCGKKVTSTLLRKICISSEWAQHVGDKIYLEEMAKEMGNTLATQVTYYLKTTVLDDRFSDYTFVFAGASSKRKMLDESVTDQIESALEKVGPDFQKIIALAWKEGWSIHSIKQSQLLQKAQLERIRRTKLNIPLSSFATVPISDSNKDMWSRLQKAIHHAKKNSK